MILRSYLRLKIISLRYKKRQTCFIFAFEIKAAGCVCKPQFGKIQNNKKPASQSGLFFFIYSIFHFDIAVGIILHQNFVPCIAFICICNGTLCA